ncbi:molybdenum cofactor biosynthesis protein MoeB [Vulcanimicrobium alpinum]|uniref:Molybdenum cofactor biosynthesis protein MoeB n=1 Tax=Vulcanimicrobium alpinum TaxID=3016050 RepID=A0AAN1XVK2_UNVUL|nr:molybdopterin-synthase adenylyltransferase MoeB [Vulcanimicrobium alpinum]BDE06243.1 molybdenum cofactor biosynthesis protein MoeB [Vulcanimicrobium alpinum]
MTTLAGSAALRRYSRHLLIPEVGLAGQEKLSRARVLVIGAGGLGSPVLAYLAAAGIGRLIVLDDDAVDETNLQRQILYDTADVGAPKAHRAAERLRALNPQIAIDALATRFEAGNARELVRLADVVVDGSDTFATRYLVNDACVLERKPDVHGAIFRFDGQLSIFGAPGGPCYRCVYPEAPPEHLVPSCAEGGVLGVLAGIVGSFQASEALKLVLGIGTPLVGRLLLVDALDARVREVRIARDPACPLCGDAPSIRDVGTVPERAAAERTVADADLDAYDALVADGAILLDVREAHERALGEVPGAVAIPATALEARLHELDTARTYVVACRVGAKSAWAAERLKEAGFGKVYHLRDGLLALAARDAAFDLF